MKPNTRDFKSHDTSTHEKVCQLRKRIFTKKREWSMKH